MGDKGNPGFILTWKQILATTYQTMKQKNPLFGKPVFIQLMKILFLKGMCLDTVLSVGHTKKDHLQLYM